MIAAGKTLAEQRDEARAEVERLRAVIAAVEALCANPTWILIGEDQWVVIVRDDLRAALDEATA